MFHLKKSVLLFLICLWPVAVWASEALVKSEVEVDITGKDAADARDQAMSKGQADGLIDLLGRVTTPEQVQSIMSGMDSGKIASMVRGTEVKDEKIATNRYRARLLITYDGDAISALIGQTGKAITSDQPAVISSFLIIPVYEEGGTTMLWDDSNPWATAWKATGIEITSGDIIVPFGDKDDESAIDPKSIATATYASLTPITVRYGVSDVVILQAKLTNMPEMTLSVVKRRISRTQNEVNLLTYRADPQETKELLLARATRDIAEGLEHKKNEALESIKSVQGGEHNTMIMLANVSNLSAWTQLRTKLSTMPMIDKLETVAIAPQQVDLVVHYRGSPDSLGNAITAQNIRLIKNKDYWIISRD